MSRNFELLSQVEIGPQSAATEYPFRTESSRAVDETISASSIRDATDGRGEEILRLVQNVFLSPDEQMKRQVIMFCGVDSEPGGSALCANAGTALAANSSRSVCLIDANVRSHRLSNIFGVETDASFPDVRASVRDRCTKVGGNLWLAGAYLLTDNRGSLQSIDELRQLIGQLRNTFEYLIVDAPGINVSADAQMLGQISDAAVLIVEANSTRKLNARKAKGALEAAGVRLLGTVLHNRSFPIPAGLYKHL